MDLRRKKAVTIILEIISAPFYPETLNAIPDPFPSELSFSLPNTADELSLLSKYRTVQRAITSKNYASVSKTLIADIFFYFTESNLCSLFLFTKLSLSVQ